MQRFSRPSRSGSLAILALSALFAPVHARADDALSDRLRELESRLSAQERRLVAQEGVIADQRRELSALKADRMDDLRAGYGGPPVGLGPDRLLGPTSQVSEGQARPRRRGDLGPDRLLAVETYGSQSYFLPRTVGEAPPGEPPSQRFAAIPEQGGVLTPRGGFLLEPSIEYSRTSSNRLVYRGVEIVPGVQLGVIEANDADRNSGVFTLGGRYGVTNRLELEFRLPYVYRSDRLTTLAQRDQSVSRTRDVNGHGLGDVEMALRYQINPARDGVPVFIGALRAKAPNARGPYDVTYDEFGVAEDLARGSGFWGAEAGVTMLYPSDPAVLFGGLGYNYNIPGDVNKTIGGAFIGRVDPGDSINASLGLGLALNPRLSLSLGYSHSYVFPTRTEIGDTTQDSTSIQIGSMLMGLSYRLDDRRTINGNFEFGVTSDAPDVRFVVRTPIQY